MTMLLKRNEIRTRAQIDLVKAPEHTRSWYPLAFSDALDIVESTIDSQGLEIGAASYGLARHDTQLFASWTIKGSSSEHNATLALRGAVNKSLSWSLIGGLTVRACSNLDLWSGTYAAVRKNTRYVTRDLVAISERITAQILPEYERKSAELGAWKAIPADLDTGYEILGRAYGHGIVNSRQLASATDSWQESEVEVHRERNAYGVYAALTHGLKAGPLSDTIDRYSRAREFFAEIVS